MADIEFGRRQHDPEDLATIMAVLKDNNQALNRISQVTGLSRGQMIALAIRHFGSLPLKEQWKLVKQYLPG